MILCNRIDLSERIDLTKVITVKIKWFATIDILIMG